MGDMGDDFRAHREYVRKRKDDRARRFYEFFEKKMKPNLGRWGVAVVMCDPFRFELPDGTRIDYWPSTGCCNVVGTDDYPRGVTGERLLGMIRKRLARQSTRQEAPDV